MATFKYTLDTIFKVQFINNEFKLISHNTDEKINNTITTYFKYR